MLRISLLLFFTSSLTFGQNYLDAAIAFRDGFSPSVSWQKLYGKKNFKIGFGLRAGAYFSGDKELLTAPAKLTSGRQSIVAFFTEYNPEKIDTMQVQNTAVASLNSMIVLQYSLKKLDFGFNIDALGFTVGPRQNGIFQAIESPEFNNTTQELRPTSFNLLLISDSDIGSLNSELFLRYNLNEKSGLRLALGFQFIEYTAAKKLTFDNDRYRLKTLLPVIAYSHKL